MEYAVMNYSSKLGIDNRHSYEFWFYSDLIRIIGDKPFARGDIIKIEEVREDRKEIIISVLGDPKVEAMPEDLLLNLNTNIIKELPVIIFLTTIIPLDEKSNYEFSCDNNSRILLQKYSIKSNNKRYAICALIKGKNICIKGLDVMSKSSFEWIIEDSKN